jgi:lipopolysaccharide/colanic/teichoic acid biosynthesis glycosyltransferase
MQECRKFWMKRLFDLSLSTVGLLITAPLWVVIAIIIKLDDAGSVFYGQERVGKGGVRFKIWKFRSMTPNSGRHVAIQQAEYNDKRVTSVGRILRTTGMDELPQLWNIFKGEMSFVGPRPLLAEEIEVDRPYEIVPLENIPCYEIRHQATPGLTGLAQVFAPRSLPRRQKFRLDLLYIKKQSFLIDMQLVALSIWIVLRGKCGEPWIRSRHARVSASQGWPAPAYRNYAPARVARIMPATQLVSSRLKDMSSQTVHEGVVTK